MFIYNQTNIKPMCWVVLVACKVALFVAAIEQRLQSVFEVSNQEWTTMLLLIDVILPQQTRS